MTTLRVELGSEVPQRRHCQGGVAPDEAAIELQMLDSV
jgi:hypothetical protein